jgi:glycosyltransferase involved in cell wall biosynthesis
LTEFVLGQKQLVRYRYHRLEPKDSAFFDDCSGERELPNLAYTGRRMLADWAFARNVALADTTADYVLKLDADDELWVREPSSCLSRLCDYLDEHLSVRFVSSAYDIMDQGAYDSRWPCVRLWRRGSESSWRQPMHEYLSGKTGSNTLDVPLTLLTRDWKDSKGDGVRVPYRNFKVLEHHRLAHPEVMDLRSPASVRFAFTWATEAAELLPVRARQVLERLVPLLHPADTGFTADVHYQLGRTHEVEGNASSAAECYKLAESRVKKLHVPSLIRLVRMLDTAELRENNHRVLKLARSKLMSVYASEIPVGCDLRAYAAITGRTVPFPVDWRDYT